VWKRYFYNNLKQVVGGKSRTIIANLCACEEAIMPEIASMSIEE
jgi:hypothetical protein